MLKLIVEGQELYDDETSTFSTKETVELELEHSLLSLSKWESNHLKPFLSAKDLTRDETFDYVMCMILTPGITKDMIEHDTVHIVSEVNAYINSPQSATQFGELPKKRVSGEVITSELIYYWLSAFRINFDPVETWHLNRLFSLIRIANNKNSPPEKLSRSERARQMHELNEKRKAENNTRG